MWKINGIPKEAKEFGENSFKCMNRVIHHIINNKILSINNLIERFYKITFLYNKKNFQNLL